MKKVLVTGASGFIGRFCLPKLVELGYEVHAVSSKKTKTSSSDVVWHSVDLLNYTEVSNLIREVKPTHLLHLAWYTEHGKFWESEQNLLWVQASIELIRHFVKNGGLRVVAAGTCAEYDWKYGYCSEYITPINPASLYGASKYSLYLVMEHFLGKNNVSFAWGRVFYLFGPGEKEQRLVPYVINSLFKNQIAHCSYGLQIRDFLYVEDVADAFVRLIDSDFVGPINIGSGNPISVRDLVMSIAKIMGKENMVIFGSVKTSLSEPKFLVADVTLLKDKLKWSPRYNLEEALERTIRSYRNELK